MDPVPCIDALPGRRLKVAVLSRNFRSTGGGAERYSMALVEQLAAKHEIHVFAQEFDQSFPGVTFHRVPLPFTRPRWINQWWFALATWLLTRKGYELVHSHENTWHGKVQTVHVLPIKYTLLAGRTGVNAILRWLKILTSPRLIAYLWLERLRFNIRDGRTIIVTSTTLYSVMFDAYPKARQALRVLTPGVTKIAEAPGAETKLAVRRLLGLPEAGHCILFVGNDFRKKGLPTLLEALKALPVSCYLAVVGNPSQVAGFEELVAGLELTSRVFFLGAMESVKPAYEAADVLAHPTLEDTFAMVVLEAMACGLPVVVSGAHYCGITALLSDGENALFLEDPQDASDLAAQLSLLLSDAKLRTRLASNGAKFAEGHLWVTQGRQLQSIYQAVSMVKAP